MRTKTRGGLHTPNSLETMNAETKPHHRHRRSRRNLAKKVFLSLLIGAALALVVGLILLLNSSFLAARH